MNRVKYIEPIIAPPGRVKLIKTLTLVLLFYLLFMFLEIPLVFNSGSEKPLPLIILEKKSAKADPTGVPKRVDPIRMRKKAPNGKLSGLVFNETSFESSEFQDEFTDLHHAAKRAWLSGAKLWAELQSGRTQPNLTKNNSSSSSATCPNSVALTGAEFYARNRVVELTCGMTLGSHVTVVGNPRWAHPEKDPKISVLIEGEEAVMVSQFFVELQGLKTVDGEDPPRILHFNPRLKGDWSGKPVVELNTCYRMQWGSPLRCEGWSSSPDEETVDGQMKCEKWLRDDDGSEDLKETWWLNRLIGRKKKMSYTWPFPFAEGKLFVLTLTAGMEGYHINVDGRHITSFPYRTGFVLEDATGVTLNGDIDVHSVIAASLPSSHPSFASQQHIEMFSKWQAPKLPDEEVELFIGILSAGNHFAERMAVRKTWMQHALIRSSLVVARFFVALSPRKEINVELQKETEYFGDIVIVPYMDHYDLVVLKTVAICEYGVRTVAAKFIMKCDDDTFLRVDAVIKEAKKVPENRSLYIGNINYYHKPLRNGKWAVSYEEWPEEEYPPYANGPGYLVSSDIAQFIVAEFESHKLRLFKMEDVSMGMWVEKFNTSKPVDYLHSLKFCQFGCIEDYYTAHYQSPRQMICLWEKLHHGKAQCCNMR